MKKWYEFHWKDGKVEYLYGTNETEAAAIGGIGLGALNALDYISEAKELPMSAKEIYYTYADNKTVKLERNTLFVERIMEQIENGLNDLEIKIAKHTWKCRVEIKPFEICLTDYL